MSETSSAVAPQSDPHRSVFTPDFLTAIERQDETGPAAEAEAAGPWLVLPLPDGRWGVVAEGDRPELGDRLVATLDSEALALRVAGLLPGTGREPLFRLGTEPGHGGYPLMSADGQVVGRLHTFQPAVAEALHTIECLERAPASFARVLLGSRGPALMRAGRLLWSWLRSPFGSQGQSAPGAG